MNNDQNDLYNENVVNNQQTITTQIESTNQNKLSFKAGLKIYLLSLFIFGILMTICLFLIIHLYGLAGGELGFMWDAGSDPDSWFAPVSILILLLFILISIFSVLKIKNIFNKKTFK